MQTRNMTRTNSMRVNEKRSLEEDGGSEVPEREKKRPMLASVIVEALKVDSLQKLCSSLEPILRRVVSEEVERALAKLGPARIAGRSPPRCIEGPDGRNLQLLFRTRLSLPLYTGGKLEGEHGAAIHVVLIDANTGHVVTSGPESSLKLDVVVLEGDFNYEDEQGWTEEEFENNIVKEREGKRPLLTGELQVMLKEGVGTIGDLIFTDNSSWIRSRKFRLGLKVAPGYCEGVRIREARTEAFAVKDHRGELYKKHYPPALYDEVWRLEKIGKDGAFHKKLAAAGINTVEEFLRLMVKDSAKLRTILGGGMSNKMWDALIEHAKTCVLSGKLYVYYMDDARTTGGVFNNIYELNGLIISEQYIPADSLNDSQNAYADSLTKKAYDNWTQVVEYDGKTLLDFRQKKSNMPRIELPSISSNYSHSSLDTQAQYQRLPASVNSESSPIAQNMFLHDSSYQDNLNTNHDSTSQFTSATFTQSNHADPNNYAVGLALHPPPSTSPFQIGSSSLQHTNSNIFDNWFTDRYKGMDDFLSEEEIRLRSNELLASEDMQHMLRLYNLGGHTDLNISDDGFEFPSGFNYTADRTRSGKAVAGWLKIKAAMRWGIFVRKKAAERRARIEELDEDV